MIVPATADALPYELDWLKEGALVAWTVVCCRWALQQEMPVPSSMRLRQNSVVKDRGGASNTPPALHHNWSEAVRELC